MLFMWRLRSTTAMVPATTTTTQPATMPAMIPGAREALLLPDAAEAEPSVLVADSEEPAFE
jgi:hypothetical protein